MKYMILNMPAHSLILSALGVVVALALFVGSADAVCLEPHPKVSAEFFKSDAVFVGTVLTESTVPEKDEAYGGWVYRLRIKKTFRGLVGDTVEVFTENSSGRYPLVVGETYLLFADTSDGRLTITNCGNSSLLSQSEDLIRQIRMIKETSGGEIEGQISVGSSGLPQAGVNIVPFDLSYDDPDHVVIHDGGSAALKFLASPT